MDNKLYSMMCMKIEAKTGIQVLESKEHIYTLKCECKWVKEALSYLPTGTIKLPHFIEVENPKSRSIKDCYKDLDLEVTQEDLSNACAELIQQMVDKTETKLQGFHDQLIASSAFGEYTKQWDEAPKKLLLTGGPANMTLVLQAFQQTFKEPKYPIIVENPPQYAVPLGAAVMAGCFYTSMFEHCFFGHAKREALSIFLFTIQLNTTNLQYLEIGDKRSDLYYHLSQECKLAIRAGVCLLYLCPCSY